MFAEIEKVADSATFIAPDGRKLLDGEATARVLLGEVEPWNSWQELLDGPGEYRRSEAEGLPIGYCQVVKASCFDEVKYEEFENFEGADWDFAVAMREKFGRETRLTGLPIVHLDHGGSQWYGTGKQF